MKKLLIVLLLSSLALAGETPKKFVVLYINDEGRVPYFSYPEGGGPHSFATHAEWFDSIQDAITWLNTNTLENDEINWQNKIRVRDVVGIFAVSQIKTKRVETGQTYDKIITETKHTQEPKHKWESPQGGQEGKKP